MLETETFKPKRPFKWAKVLDSLLKRAGLKQNALGNLPALGIWAAWAQIWPEWESGSHFEYLGGLALDMASVGLSGLILSIWPP